MGQRTHMLPYRRPRPRLIGAHARPTLPPVQLGRSALKIAKDCSRHAVVAYLEAISATRTGADVTHEEEKEEQEEGGMHADEAPARAVDELAAWAAGAHNEFVQDSGAAGHYGYGGRPRSTVLTPDQIVALSGLTASV